MLYPYCLEVCLWSALVSSRKTNMSVLYTDTSLIYFCCKKSSFWRAVILIFCLVIPFMCKNLHIVDSFTPMPKKSLSSLQISWRYIFGEPTITFKINIWAGSDNLPDSEWHDCLLMSPVILNRLMIRGQLIYQCTGFEQSLHNLTLRLLFAIPLSSKGHCYKLCYTEVRKMLVELWS